MSPKGWTDGQGRRLPGTPKGWPFGTTAPAAPEEQHAAWARVERAQLQQVRSDRRERVQQLPEALF